PGDHDPWGGGPLTLIVTEPLGGQPAPNRTSVLARPTGFERADAINIRIPNRGRREDHGSDGLTSEAKGLLYELDVPTGAKGPTSPASEERARRGHRTPHEFRETLLASRSHERPKVPGPPPSQDGAGMAALLGLVMLPNPIIVVIRPWATRTTPTTAWGMSDLL